MLAFPSGNAEDLVCGNRNVDQYIGCAEKRREASVLFRPIEQQMAPLRLINRFVEKTSLRAPLSYTSDCNSKIGEIAKRTERKQRGETEEKWKMERGKWRGEEKIREKIRKVDKSGQKATKRDKKRRKQKYGKKK